MRISTNVSLILSALFLLTYCQQHDVQVKNVTNGIELNAIDKNIKIQFYNKNIVRIIKWPSDGQSNKKSLSVINNTDPDLDIAISEESNRIYLLSNSLKLSVSKSDFSVKYSSIAKNDEILEEKGESVFTPVVYDGDSGFSLQQNFQLTQDEGIYGLGQHQNGYFNYRNKKITLAQSNTEAVNPFLISTLNYGILWDNYSKTIFEESNGHASFWSDMGDNIDYYFVYGESMDEVISGYRKLTGKAPMYGKYAFGYWQSKEHYDTQAELMSVARKYRKLNIPIDNMIQDWDYWNGAENWSGMFFDKILFPKPKQMCDQLHQMNYHIIISIWPALGPNTPIYADMLKRGYLYKPVGWAGFKYYDAYNPDANKLYWKYLKKGIYSKGLDGWWIDSTEPDVVNAMTK
ncbi:MAG: glycoside hydrolase family 31 protein, partial [Calditrichaceae bacterium]